MYLSKITDQAIKKDCLEYALREEDCARLHELATRFNYYIGVNNYVAEDNLQKYRKYLGELQARKEKEERYRQHTVKCDRCGTDGDLKNEDGSPALLGGGIVGEDFCCPYCLKASAPDEREDVGVFDQSKSFGDNVREHRKAFPPYEGDIVILGDQK